MLMLRLQRIGRRNEAHFKIVVIEKTRGPKSQKYIDIVGSYNPKMGTVQMNEEKVKVHLANGVQPSDTVYNMLITKGLIQGRKKNALPKKSPVIDEAKIAREKAEVEAKIAAEKKARELAEAEAKAAAETEVAKEESVDVPTADELEAALEGAPEEMIKTEE
jgi:small subunit ribosomal protein S16